MGEQREREKKVNKKIFLGYRNNEECSTETDFRRKDFSVG